MDCDCDYDFDRAVTRALESHIKLLVSPQEATPHSLQNGVCVPQKRYEKGAGRGLPTNQSLVVFVRQDGSYIPVTTAVLGDYGGLVNRDIPVLTETGFTITVRFEWPGYPSREFQLRTYDWCTPPKKVSLSKLATEVAKIVQQFVEKTQGQTIAQGHEMWRVGPNGIQAKDLRIGALEQVSAGSWQIRLFYKPEL